MSRSAIFTLRWCRPPTRASRCWTSRARWNVEAIGLDDPKASQLLGQGVIVVGRARGEQDLQAHLIADRDAIGVERHAPASCDGRIRRSGATRSCQHSKRSSRRASLVEQGGRTVDPIAHRDPMRQTLHVGLAGPPRPVRHRRCPSVRESPAQPVPELAVLHRPRAWCVSTCTMIHTWRAFGTYWSVHRIPYSRMPRSPQRCHEPLDAHEGLLQLLVAGGQAGPHEALTRTVRTPSPARPRPGARTAAAR